MVTYRVSDRDGEHFRYWHLQSAVKKFMEEYKWVKYSSHMEPMLSVLNRNGENFVLTNDSFENVWRTAQENDIISCSHSFVMLIREIMEDD